MACGDTSLLAAQIAFPLEYVGLIFMYRFMMSHEASGGSGR